MVSTAKVGLGLFAFGALVFVSEWASEWAPGDVAWASRASSGLDEPPAARAARVAPARTIDRAPSEGACAEPEVVCGVGQSACGSVCFSPAAGQICCPDRRTVCGVGQSCCGHNCYYPAQGQICCPSTSTVCGVGQACCGATCYRPSAGESCH
jgi:hypothetical protein